MTSKHQGNTRQFTILSQGWYADSSIRPADRAKGVDEITLGFYCAEGGTSGEFRIVWRELEGCVEPQLQAWEDSWSALAQFPDVLAKLAELDGTNPTVEEVTSLLKSCGVQDRTQRISPYKESTEDARTRAATLVAVINPYLQALTDVRALGRTVSGNVTWAADAELGAKVEALQGLSHVFYDSVTQLAGALRPLCNELATTLSAIGDPALSEQYAHLTLFAGKVHGVE
jgi:hypothetical protein